MNNETLLLSRQTTGLYKTCFENGQPLWKPAVSWSPPTPEHVTQSAHVGRDVMTISSCRRQLYKPSDVALAIGTGKGHQVQTVRPMMDETEKVEIKYICSIMNDVTNI